METLDNKKQTLGFFNHVFKFDESSKGEMTNIIQYALLAIVPIVILNKLMQKYVPEADENKGSLEILAEVVFQILGMFLGLLLIHRMITYVPTYSELNYPEFHVIFNVLATLMVLLSLQTKLGEKVSILLERLSVVWNGKSSSDSKTASKVKITQPISQGHSGQPIYNNTNQTFSDGTSINQLPVLSQSSQDPYQYPQPTQQQQTQQPATNYDNMYRPDTNKLVGAASPSMDNQGGVMAASDMLGGSFGSFSSW
jgi:hypothetical protein